MCIASTPLFGRVTEWLRKIDIEHEYEYEHDQTGSDGIRPIGRAQCLGCRTVEWTTPWIGGP
jgi:hypothetical protein